MNNYTKNPHSYLYISIYYYVPYGYEISRGINFRVFHGRLCNREFYHHENLLVLVTPTIHVAKLSTFSLIRARTELTGGTSPFLISSWYRKTRL